MGHDAAACCVLAHGAMPTLKDEPAAASDTFSCLTLPSFLEASSPSSEPSTSSSSTSELFTSVGLGNEASTPFDSSSGGDQTSALSTYHYKPSSSNLDCGGFSSTLNIPPPILEEDLGISIDELDDVDHMSSENLNLEDTKPSANEMYLSDGGCWADSGCCDDVFMLRLDELLQSGNPQDFVVESGLTSMDDLFPDLSTAPEFSVLDDMSAWSGADTMQSLDSCLFPDAANVQAESSSGFGGEEESASQLFARWLQSNAHWISLSDLRKIKLKTSTIENATKRLGGGKKGLMLFLRFVLMWVQNSRDNLEVQKGTSPAPMLQSSNISPASCYLGTTAMSSVQGISRKDALCAPEAPDVLPGAKMHMHALSAHGSSPTPPLSADWTTPRAQGAIQTMIHPNANLSIHFPSSYTSITSGSACSPLPSTNCAQSNNPWLHQSANVVRGVHSQSMSSLPSVIRGSISRCTYGADVSSMMSSLQQHHCTDATPAATTRAARKSRMERQRWSVRHNRRWSGASLHHRLSASAASSGSAHTGLTSWSQNLRTGAQKSSYPSSQTCQQNSKGATAMEYQQNKRPERNLKLLFHKELKQSDVGSLGRIVLPKAAEICLPPLELRDGVNLLVEDINSSKVWNMRYRFWPNNKSRMYLLENTSDFVKLYDLKEGDNMMMYVDVVSNRNVIRGVKGSRPAVASGSSNDVSNDGGHEAAAADEAACKRRRSLSKEEASLVSVGDSCDESLFVEFIEQSLDDLKDST